jgi:hypothetical protein
MRDDDVKKAFDNMRVELDKVKRLIGVANKTATELDQLWKLANLLFGNLDKDMKNKGKRKTLSDISEQMAAKCQTHGTDSKLLQAAITALGKKIADFNNAAG